MPILSLSFEGPHYQKREGGMNGLRYIRVKWKHSFSDEPVEIYSELDENRWEVRKVEIYPDGSASFADSDKSIGASRLGDLPIPKLEEINQDPQFEGTEIDAAEFSRVWQQVVEDEPDE